MSHFLITYRVNALCVDTEGKEYRSIQPERHNVLEAESLDDAKDHFEVFCQFCFKGVHTIVDLSFCEISEKEAIVRDLPYEYRPWLSPELMPYRDCKYGSKITLESLSSDLAWKPLAN